MRPIDLDTVEFLKTDDKKHQYAKGFNAGVDSCIAILLKQPVLDIKPAKKRTKRTQKEVKKDG